MTNNKNDALEALKRMTETLVCYMEDNGDADLYNDDDFKLIKTALTNADPKWRDISSAPKDGTRLLLLTEKYGASTGHFDEDLWHIHSCLNQDAIITHWMPLPQPPKEGE